MQALTDWNQGEAERLRSDPRYSLALEHLEAGHWYAAHDALEELWHETAGPCRPLLQGLLQLAVSQLHLERGNRHGATVLLGEALGRLSVADGEALGMDLSDLCAVLRARLGALQSGEDPTDQPIPTPRPD